MLTQQEFGKKLRAFRKDKQQNQEQLAAIANTTTATISRWENGQMTPNILDILSISQYYGVTIEDMLDLKKKNVQ